MSFNDRLPIVISPDCADANFNSRLANVLLPEPLRPTSAVWAFAAIVSDSPLSARRPLP